MNLALAEKILDYQLASGPEEALWLDRTKYTVSCTFLDQRQNYFRQSGESCARNRTGPAGPAELALCNVTEGEEQEHRGSTWNRFTRGSCWRRVTGRSLGFLLARLCIRF